MSIFRKRLGKKSSESETGKAGQNAKVEDIVADLRRRPPDHAVCYVILFGDRPLTNKVVQDEADLACFTTKGKADAFLQDYQKVYRCTEPLTALALGTFEELWAMLHNEADYPDCAPPFGLLININYSRRAFNRYGLSDIRRLGIEGLKKGFSGLS
jgi:hypothetical protein